MFNISYQNQNLMKVILTMVFRLHDQSWRSLLSIWRTELNSLILSCFIYHIHVWLNLHINTTVTFIIRNILWRKTWQWSCSRNIRKLLIWWAKNIPKVIIENCWWLKEHENLKVYVMLWTHVIFLFYREMLFLSSLIDSQYWFKLQH